MKWSAAARWTTLIKVMCIVALPMAILTFAANASGQGIRLLGPEDTAIAIDLDSVAVGAMNNGRYPANEAPAKAIDGLAAIPGPPPSFSKYLNFGGAGSGFIVSPGLAGIPIDGFQITTANDAPARDPASYALYGYNGTLVTMDSGPDPSTGPDVINQTGLAENEDGVGDVWNLISSGPLSLPGDPAMGGDQRGVVGPRVEVGSITGYDHYKMIFPTIKNAGISNIMQIAEVQFFADDTPGSGLLGPTDAIIAVDETPTPPGFSGSSYPGGEAPRFGIDQSRDPVTGLANTKYLNFGEERSGIIITNSSGPVKVDSMGLITGNDSAERDPASYELYGTNDPITSQDNSNSNGTEAWTLISQGALSLPGDPATDDGRRMGVIVPINAPAAYTSYRLLFPTVKDATAANSMQIADIQFFTVPEPSTVTLVAMVGLALAVAMRRRS